MGFQLFGITHLTTTKERPLMSAETRVRDIAARLDDDEPDMVNHPPHYQHPSGIQCIEVSRICHSDMGAAIQYIWRYADKGRPVEDLRKARWYLCDIIENGLASFPPWRAKNLLLDVIAAETDPLRRKLLTFISVGQIDHAIAAITDFVGD